jgi:glycosyltransferase involved in cell wall biosynthesis
VKTAIVHDWFVTYGGADRVVEQMLNCFPDADLFGLIDFLPEEQRHYIQGKRINTSFLQHLPFARSRYRKYFPLMPIAVEQFDVSQYDLVLSSSHCVAKGVITGPNQVHICMCYSPMRYAWDLQHQYLEESGLDKGPGSLVARWLLHKGRIWDTRTANGVDDFIAISRFIARRIWKTYRRHSTVIYPPVDIDGFSATEDKDDFYLTVSRLVPYKKVGLIVEAFNQMPGKRLVVIGAGPNFNSIQSIAARNVTMLGFQDTEVVRQHMQRAKAFVFAAEEDFGISVVEAQASGTPVIAFGKGGALETIRDISLDSPTGIFFYEQTPRAIVDAISLFEQERGVFNAQSCRHNAVRFSVERFRNEFRAFCEEALERANMERNPQLDTSPSNVISQV